MSANRTDQFKKKEIGLNVGHDGARLTARRPPGARLPMSTSQIPPSASRGARRSSFAASEPGSFRLMGTFKGPTGKMRKATKMHVHPCCRLGANRGPASEPEVASRIVSQKIGFRLRPILLRNCETARSGAVELSPHICWQRVLSH